MGFFLVNVLSFLTEMGEIICTTTECGGGGGGGIHTGISTQVTVQNIFAQSMSRVLNSIGILC